MSKKYNVAKLIYISDDQKQELMEIKKMVTEAGGTTSISQIIRDSIDLATFFYKDKIVEQYRPRSIKDKWS